MAKKSSRANQTAKGAKKGKRKIAAAVEAAVAATTPKMKSMSAGRMGYSTSEVGDLVAEAIAGG